MNLNRTRVDGAAMAALEALSAVSFVFRTPVHAVSRAAWLVPLCLVSCQPSVPVSGAEINHDAYVATDGANGRVSATGDTQTTGGGPDAVTPADASRGLPAEKNAPKLVMSAPKDGATTADPTVHVTGVVTDDTAVAALTLKVGLNVASPISFSPDDGTFAVDVALPPGAHKLVARAYDVAGNQATATVTVTVEST